MNFKNNLIKKFRINNQYPQKSNHIQPVNFEIFSQNLLIFRKIQMLDLITNTKNTSMKKNDSKFYQKY